jgi:hypothetical protein
MAEIGTETLSRERRGFFLATQGGVYFPGWWIDFLAWLRRRGVLSLGAHLVRAGIVRRGRHDSNWLLI